MTSAFSRGDVLFVGQAPNAKGDPGAPLNGMLGMKMAKLLGVSLGVWLSMRRVNLLAAWPGKKGKGDAFDLTAGSAHAEALMNEADRFVLLGRWVSLSFGLRWEPLLVHRCRKRQFICLPHPSGINRWWNSRQNYQAAERALRLFVNGTTSTKKPK